MRLSKSDDVEPGKRRHFEISIDSPFHILSCKASQANTALPAYSSPQSADQQTELLECGCPGAPVRRISPQYIPTLDTLNDTRSSSVSEGPGVQSSTPAQSTTRLQNTNVGSIPDLPRPPLAHVHTNTPQIQRPIHMLRAPSFNPPSFEEELPPPPLVTPPPQYNDIASPSSGLADYFSRLADQYDDDSDENINSKRGRVNIPLTPGSRVNRSMEIQRGQWQAALGGT